jgi:hypothetical protein
MIDPIQRGNEWARIWEGEDGLKQAFENIKLEYFKRAGLIEPWEGDKLGKLALAARIVDMVQDHAQAIIDTGKIAEDAQSKANRIADLPEHKRKFLGL